MAEMINAIMRSIGAIVSSVMKSVGRMAKGIEKGIIGTTKFIAGTFKGAEKALRIAINIPIAHGGKIQKTIGNRNFISRSQKIEIKIFRSDISEIMSDQTIRLVMQKFKVAQPEQSVVNILYVGGKAGAEAGYVNYQKTGNMNSAIRVARNEAIVGATGQAIREIPNFTDGGNPMVNYAEERICNKAADKAEHELRKELANRNN